MRLKRSDILPDGVRIVIDWDKFVVGTSVFIPCINTKRAMDHIVDASELPRKSFYKRACVEGGCYGLRVWRVC